MIKAVPNLRVIESEFGILNAEDAESAENETDEARPGRVRFGRRLGTAAFLRALRVLRVSPLDFCPGAEPRLHSFNHTPQSGGQRSLKIRRGPRRRSARDSARRMMRFLAGRRSS